MTITPSPTQRRLTPDDVAALVRASFGPLIGVADGGPLTGGGFAAVWRVRLTDGRMVVLKVAPRPEVEILSYEAGLVAAEVEYFRLVREQAPGVPVPLVLFHGHDRDILDGDWLFTTHLPGIALSDLDQTDLDQAAAPGIRRQLGAAVAAVHTVTGDRFGYTGGRAHGSTWRKAFTAVIDELLADADQWRVRLPVPADRIVDLVARNGDVLDQVTRPALVHFDLWDGNVLAVGDRLTGLVDGERYLYGDPLVDFVSPALRRRIEDEPDHAFTLGYAEATGRPVTFDEAERRRLTLYRAHLYLLMTVEMPSRGMTAQTDPERHEHLPRMLAAELDHLAHLAP